MLTIVPVGLLPGDPYLLAFVTSDVTQGNFGRVEGGDGFVNQVVGRTNSDVTCDTSGCPSYSAILSDSDLSANSRPIPGGVPVYNTAGQLVASSYAELWSGGPLENPIAYDEAGRELSTDVWTGTDATGSHAASAADWSGDSDGTIGGTLAEGSEWVDKTDQEGDLEFSLYGISTDVITVPIGLRPGSVYGMKFEDINGNGVKDPGEPGLEGWTMELIGTELGGNQVSRSTVTNNQGEYWFEDVIPGTFVVTEVAQADWVQTTPQPGELAVGPGDEVLGVDFGNFQLIDICGMKFDDVNNNGVQDEGEPGLVGWTIFIDADGDGVMGGNEMSVVTDENGEYCFRDLGPGTYLVREVQQAGWIATMGANGYTINAMSGVDPNSGQCSCHRRATTMRHTSSFRIHNLSAEARWLLRLVMLSRITNSLSVSTT